MAITLPALLLQDQNGGREISLLC